MDSLNRCGSTSVVVRVPARLSHTGKARFAEKPIDTCIADLVKALTEAGVYTDQSCCCHGEGIDGTGVITLADGRKLIVHFPDDWEAHMEPSNIMPLHAAT